MIEALIKKSAFVGIENHAILLSGKILDTVIELGYECMTPTDNFQRSGNVSFLADDLQAVKDSLEAQRVLIWGAYAGFGRLRISTHLYNDSHDIDRCIKALQNVNTIS